MFAYGGHFGKPPRMRYIEMPAFTYKSQEILKSVPFIASLYRAALSHRAPASAATCPAQGHYKRNMTGLGPPNEHTCGHTYQSQIYYSAENSKNPCHEKHKQPFPSENYNRTFHNKSIKKFLNCSILVRCSILILLMKTVRFSIRSL